jgi:hypothetical protein
VTYETLFEDADVVRALRRSSPAVEIWPDKTNPDLTMRYLWVVDHRPPTTRRLAYLRSDGTRVQRRAYDSRGEEEWLDVELLGNTGAP